MSKVYLLIFTLLCVIIPQNYSIAQNDVQLNIDFENEALGQVLQMLKNGYGLEYVLGKNIDAELPITTHLRGVMLNDALTIILEPNGLIAVNQNGRYVINKRVVPVERDISQSTIFSTPNITRTPPDPIRTVTYSAGATPTNSSETEDDDEEEQVINIIWPHYLGADTAAMIFGGSIIENTGMYGGSTGGNSYGNSGSSNSRGYGNNRGNSNYGSRGSQGSNRNYGNSGNSRNSRNSW